MPPTVLSFHGYRFFFFSSEEKRIHIHIVSNGAEAKFWIEPNIELSINNGFNSVEINELRKIIIKNETKIRDSWNNHFAS